MAPFPVQPHTASPAPRNRSGCLFWFAIGCASLIVLALAFVAFIAFVVEGSIKSTDAYKMARARATTDPRVAAALGTPVTAGWYVTGNANVNNGSKTADIQFPISGPKEKADVLVV